MKSSSVYTSSIAVGITGLWVITSAKDLGVMAPLFAAMGIYISFYAVLSVALLFILVHLLAFKISPRIVASGSMLLTGCGMIFTSSGLEGLQSFGISLGIDLILFVLIFELAYWVKCKWFDH